MLLQTVLFTVLATSAVQIAAHNSLATPLRFFGDATAGPVNSATFPCGVGQDQIESTFDAAPTAGQYSAGGQIAVKYSSTTYHTGGSCQFSVSNDKGTTWKVLQSIEGSCPNGNGASVPIPSSFPGGDYIFSWGWYPRSSGAVEFYHACSRISISGTGSSSDLSALPDALIAGVSGLTDCVTDQSSGHLDLFFPNPGNQVIINDASTGSSGDDTPIITDGAYPGKGLVAASCAAQLAGASTAPITNSGSSSNDTSSAGTAGSDTDTPAYGGSSSSASSDAAGIFATNNYLTAAKAVVQNTAVAGGSSVSGASAATTTARQKTTTSGGGSTAASGGGSTCDTAWSACNSAWQSGGSTGPYTCQTDYVKCRSGAASRHRRSPQRIA